MASFDDAYAHAIEAMYRTADIVAQRAAALTLLDPQAGEGVLDIGCGPGQLAREIAQRVGFRGSVCGLDPSRSMLAIASRGGSGEGAETVTFILGEA
jgi:ubiquinone/menaquinone biosynthesis C-methylase UbiE